MTDKDFQSIVKAAQDSISRVLSSKAEEYARGDRLSNFKRAAALKKSTPERALEGMMTKHIVALYDYLDDLENGKDMPLAVWDEKIGDTINYLILLKALLRDRYESRHDVLLCNFCGGTVRNYHDATRRDPSRDCCIERHRKLGIDVSTSNDYERKKHAPK